MAEGILVVQVSSPRARPISAVVLSTKGDGSTGPPTDVAGKTRMKLAVQTRPGHWVSLQVVSTPKDQDLVFVSPWDARAAVPPFENEAENFVPVVLAERGDRALLEYPKALAEKIIAANAPKSASEQITEEQRRQVLEEISKEYGLEPDEVDQAIRAWGEKAKDPYEIGLAALFARNYPEASARLAESLEKKEHAFVDNAMFLGHSLYEQGRYAESASAYAKARALREDDPEILNFLGVALYQAGRFAEAEPSYQRSLSTREKALGPDHPDVAQSLNNLAGLYYNQGKYPLAEPLYKRVLAIREKALGPDHPDVAQSLNNLALFYYNQGQYGPAEPLYKRALAIWEKGLGPDHPDVATVLNNLAVLYLGQGQHAQAEPLLKRSLAIQEKALGPDHPDVAGNLYNLAALYGDQGQYAQAEPLYKRALAIWERALGPDHPYVATVLSNLALLYRATDQINAAEELEKRAARIRPIQR